MSPAFIATAGLPDGQARAIAIGERKTEQTPCPTCGGSGEVTRDVAGQTTWFSWVHEIPVDRATWDPAKDWEFACTRLKEKGAATNIAVLVEEPGGVWWGQDEWAFSRGMPRALRRLLDGEQLTPRE
jgi:hypothetical protein